MGGVLQTRSEPSPHCPALTLLLVEGVERSAQPFQSTANRFSLSAEAYAEVLRLLEKFSWHDAGFKLLAQHGDKFVGVACAEPRKHSCPKAAGLAIERRMCRQEFVY